MSSECLLLAKHQIEDVVPLSLIVTTSVCFFVFVLKRWRAAEAMRSTPGLEKKVSKPMEKPNRKPGSMFVMNKQLAMSILLTMCLRMDAVILQETTGTSISRLGCPHNKANPLSAVQIWAVSCSGFKPTCLTVAGDTLSRWDYGA
jgi:hypothetical protein